MKQGGSVVLKCLVLLILPMALCAVNIKLLKDTVLPSMNPAYAPCWGLSMWEKRIAEQIHKFSAEKMLKDAQDSLKNVKPEQDAKKARILQILKAQTNTATEDLIRQMFVETGGTFNVTNAPNNPVRLLLPEHIGHVLQMVFQVQLASDIQTYLGNLGLKKPSGSNYGGKDFKPFVDALLGAVQECSSVNPNKIYPENTAQAVVLGYLLAKSNERHDLQNYLQGFTGLSSLSLDVGGYSVTDFETILKTFSDLNKVLQFADFMCAMIYKQNYASLLPKFVENKNVAYCGVRLNDCVETTIRLLCNVATYSPENNKLGQALTGVAEMSKKLKIFYSQKESHQDSAAVGNQDTHQAWVDLVAVENVPGMLYARLLDVTTQNFIELLKLEKCAGAMPIDKDDSLTPKSIDIAGQTYQVREKNIDGKIYWLVPKDSGLVCYELLPRVSNIIVALNDLFNLNLYESVDNVLQPTFVQDCFEKMCTKLNWRISKEQVTQAIEFEQGALEMAKLSIRAVQGSTGQGPTFVLNLIQNKHAFVSMDEAYNSSIKISQNVLATADGKTQAACVSLGFVDHERLQQLQVGSFFYQSIINSDQRLAFVRYFMLHPSSTVEPYIVKLIMSLGDLGNRYYQDEILKIIKDFKTISQPIVQALVVMTTMAHLKYNYPEISMKYCQFLLSNASTDFDALSLLMNGHIFDQSTLDILHSLNIKNRIPREYILLIVSSWCKQYDPKKVAIHVDKEMLEMIQSWLSEETVSIDTSKLLPFFQKIARRNTKEYAVVHHLRMILDIVKTLVTKNLIGTNDVRRVLELLESIIDSDNGLFLYKDAIAVIDLLINKNLIANSHVEKVLTLAEIMMNEDNVLYILQNIIRPTAEQQALAQESLLPFFNFIEQRFLMREFSLPDEAPRYFLTKRLHSLIANIKQRFKKPYTSDAPPRLSTRDL